jgi:hypothetical protein
MSAFLVTKGSAGFRHCERSNPSFRVRGDNGLLRCARNDGMISTHTPSSSPRRRGSSTPRPIGSIIDVSGILGHPPQCAIAHKAGDNGICVVFSRHELPEVCLKLPALLSEGAGKTGCLLHPRSRVRFAQTKVHTSIQGSGSIPAFPAQWLYGLLRALPGERLFCLRRRRDTALDPIGSMRNRQLSASTAAPEPHDLTVRFRRVRLSRPPRPSHLTARS